MLGLVHSNLGPDVISNPIPSHNTATTKHGLKGGGAVHSYTTDSKYKILNNGQIFTKTWKMTVFVYGQTIPKFAAVFVSLTLS